MSPRIGGRPSRDRVVVSFYVGRAGKQAVEKLAEENGVSKSDAYRALLRLGLQQAQARPQVFRDALG